MADVHNTKTRSYNMSQIKATNTKPEILVRKFLHAQGFRYKLHITAADQQAIVGGYLLFGKTIDKIVDDLPEIITIYNSKYQYALQS